MSIQKKCTVCGKEFTAKNDKGIYCSNSCRVKAYREKEKGEKGEQDELAKNISKTYAEELSFFKMRLNDMHKDVQKLQSEMVTVTKYLYSFTEKVASIPDMQMLTSDINDLSDKFNDEINLMKNKYEEKIEKNDYNIRLIGLELIKIGGAINRINNKIDNSSSNNIRADMLDKILNSDMIPDLVDKFIKRKSETSE